jgi:hypothetical protein
MVKLPQRWALSEPGVADMGYRLPACVPWAKSRTGLVKNSPNNRSSHLAFHLSDLHAVIDQIADEAEIKGSQRSSVEATLLALPSFYRRRVVLALQSRKAFATEPELQTACTILLEQAANLWAQAAAAPVQPMGLSLSLVSDLPVAAKASTK